MLLYVCYVTVTNPFFFFFQVQLTFEEYMEPIILACLFVNVVLEQIFFVQV